jgi:hypothetical protein
MRNCLTMSRYTIMVMIISMKKKGPYTLHSPLACHEHVTGRHVDFRCPKSCRCGYWTLPLSWNVLWKLQSPEISSSCIRWNICTQNALQTTLSASIRCWMMDCLYAFKCKCVRNTHHATLGIPL